MSKSEKTAADYGITLTGAELEEFDRKYRENVSKEFPVRTIAGIILSTFFMAGASIWTVAADVSELWIKISLMLLPAASIVVLIISLFEKAELSAVSFTAFRRC